ncbi:hypothetical protein, partial [Salmonella enterica]|uniref:hypothetical protein n=1 Tax=Salmonella enterica TaxID=28901 RepID=UPI00195C18DF
SNKTKGPVGRQGLLFSSVVCRMAAPPYSAYRNYPAYEAGAIVEPIRAQPTQSLTMNYPLHVLI